MAKPEKSDQTNDPKPDPEPEPQPRPRSDPELEIRAKMRAGLTQEQAEQVVYAQLEHDGAI